MLRGRRYTAWTGNKQATIQGGRQIGGKQEVGETEGGTERINKEKDNKIKGRKFFKAGRIFYLNIIVKTKIRFESVMLIGLILARFTTEKVHQSSVR